MKSVGGVGVLHNGAAAVPGEVGKANSGADAPKGWAGVVGDGVVGGDDFDSGGSDVSAVDKDGVGTSKNSNGSKMSI